MSTFCVIASIIVSCIDIFLAYVLLIIVLFQSIVCNDTTLPADCEKRKGLGESSGVIRVAEKVKVEDVVSTNECLNSDPIVTVSIKYFWK